MNRKKISIGIITINDNKNIGNRLQNYAMSKILNEYGDAYTIKYFNFIHSKKNIIISCIINYFKQVIRFFLSFKQRFKISYKRNKNFKNFNKNINYKFYIFKGNEKKIDNFFNCYVIGSDQIWNPNFFDEFSYNFAFFSQKKKIAISPSIACDTLTIDQYAAIKKYLVDVNSLSCREEQGSLLIEKITGRKCITLIDPTFMLSAEDWLKVSNKPTFHDAGKKYLLLYFLGNISDDYFQIIERISKEKNLVIINIYDKNSFYYSCGPSEFIYLIANCELMLTDSFHGSVFSIIFNKPFKIFKRKGGSSMNSRMLNLVNVFALNDVFIDNEIDFNSILNINYDSSCLIKEQKKFEQYLKENLVSLNGKE